MVTGSPGLSCLIHLSLSGLHHSLMLIIFKGWEGEEKKEEEEEPLGDHLNGGQQSNWPKKISKRSACIKGFINTVFISSLLFPLLFLSLSPAEQPRPPPLSLVHVFSPSFLALTPLSALLLFSHSPLVPSCSVTFLLIISSPSAGSPSPFIPPPVHSQLHISLCYSLSPPQVLDDGSVSDTFTHKSLFPEDMDPLTVSGTLHPDGTLVVSVRRATAPVGVEPPGVPMYRSEAHLWPPVLQLLWLGFHLLLKGT